MKNSLIKKIIFLTFLVVLLMSKISGMEAATTTGNRGGGGGATINNPTRWEKFEDLINSLIDFLFTFGLAIFPIIIVSAGYMLMTSAGEPEKINQAKKLLVFALIGICLIFMSKGLISILGKTFGTEEPPKSEQKK